MATFKDALTYAQHSVSIDELRVLAQTVHDRVESIGRMLSFEFKQGDRIQFEGKHGLGEGLLHPTHAEERPGEG